jgi:hypothetical protein
MMIWRNLDPKLLGELLVAGTEVLAQKRAARRDADPAGAPFRPALAADAASRRNRRHSRP